MLLENVPSTPAMRGGFILLWFCGLSVLLLPNLEAKSWVVPRGRWWSRTKSYGAGRGPYYFVGKRQSSEGYCLMNDDCPVNHCCVSRNDGSGIATCVYRPRTGEVCYPKSTWGENMAENGLADINMGQGQGQGRAAATAAGTCDCAVGLTCVTLSQQGFGLCIPDTDSASPFASQDMDDVMGG